MYGSSLCRTLSCRLYFAFHALDRVLADAQLPATSRPSASTPPALARLPVLASAHSHLVLSYLQLDEYTKSAHSPTFPARNFWMCHFLFSDSLTEK